MMLACVAMTGCRARVAPEEKKAQIDDRMSSLFQCETVAQDNDRALANLKITAQRPEDPRLKPSIFITLGNGARVKAHCGQRYDLDAQGVFACWYTGGGLTVAWPEREPPEEAFVKVDRERLFGAIGSTVHKLRCTREDTLEAVRQASL